MRGFALHNPPLAFNDCQFTDILNGYMEHDSSQRGSKPLWFCLDYYSTGDTNPLLCARWVIAYWEKQGIPGRNEHFWPRAAAKSPLPSPPYNVPSHRDGLENLHTHRPESPCGPISRPNASEKFRVSG